MNHVPASSYSSLLTHSCWKVDSDPKIEAPIHTLYFLSGGATTFTLRELGASATISLVSLSSKPGNREVPPRVH